MKSRRGNKLRRMRRLARQVMKVGAVVGVTLFVVLTLAGFRWYSAAGLDFERRADDGRISYTYVRVRWPGDGSVWLGGESTRVTSLKREPEVVDLGGRFFRRARPAVPQTVWNRLGFWVVREPGRAWVGVPGVLVVAGMGAGGAWMWRRLRSKAGSAESHVV